MRDAIADLPSPDDLHTDFYDRTRMADWVNEYPGEVLWVRQQLGQTLAGWRPYGNWSHAPDDANSVYIIDETARLRDQTHPQDGMISIIDGITRLRSRLAAPGGIVRLTGLSGTGKTRLLEALFDPNIGEQPLDPSLAIYADIGHESPEPRPSQLATQLTAEGRRAILLMDNCPSATHDAIAQQCQSSPVLSLITVDLDIQDDITEGTDVFRLLNASESVIKGLLDQRYPALPEPVRWRIAVFSGGNARVALLIAHSVSPDTNLADLGNEGMFRRLFHQRNQADAGLLQAAEALALVYSFDGETLDSDQTEITLLAGLAGLDSRTLYRSVAELKRRDIIQCRGRWRAILPQPLANWLAKRALENQPALGIADRFWSYGNPRLLRSFAHRLSYLHDSPEARRIAEAWLSATGPLVRLREIASSSIDPRHDLIEYMAAVNPTAVLSAFDQFTMNASLDELGPQSCWHCKPWVFLLRKIAWFPELFQTAVRVLVRFVWAGRDTHGALTNANQLEELFWLRLSGTKADASQRLAALEELLFSADEPAQELGMIALRGMLRSGYFSGSVDCGFGGYPIDEGWQPADATERRDWYLGALAIAKRLAFADSPRRAEARKAIADHFRDLWCFEALFDELEALAQEINAQDYWPEGWLAVRHTIALDADRMDATLLDRLRKLEERLVPTDRWARFRAYVMQPLHKILDTEHGDDADGYAQASEAAVEEARQLGREIAETQDFPASVWNDLFSPAAHQASWVGEGYAEAVAAISEGWASLVERYGASKQDSRNSALMGGFLRKSAEMDRTSVERFLDEAVSDPVLGPVFPFLQLQAGIEGGAVRRLIESAEGGLAQPRAYWGLVFGRTTENIPAEDLARLILSIASSTDGLAIAGNILCHHFRHKHEDELSWDTSLLECGRKLLREHPLDQQDDTAIYHLTEIAKVCLPGEEGVQDAHQASRRILEMTTDRYRDWRTLRPLVSILLELHPLTVLDCWLGGRDDPRWLQWMSSSGHLDRNNPLSKVPTAILLDWAHAAPETRFPRLATVVTAFEKVDGIANFSQTTLSLLQEAPDRSAVLEALAPQFRPNSFGSRADLLEERRSLILPFLDDEDVWVAGAALEIERTLQDEIAFEREREGNRDERFE
ncbi:hypothetical protein ThidrDRAFT_3591 [Thiorhodococcus drewsii AZ1]|uniref:Uncharacterized protein n=1 Tax=Thiorhodococcus drewsii AZ1 TaxID=765913 RepID=G2E5M8_9GAMM|nr:hypothetical protein [Thiorhodococcus drewsii]EGV28599.1 hypothetical protein ThidrDRAFT_3591 [Thiorhodococcus drewsii AZ1]